MKRLFALALAVLTALCLASALAEAPDETLAMECVHKSFEANQLEAVLSRHESVTYSFTYPLEPESSCSGWLTKDSVFSWAEPGFARFERDRVVYDLSCDEATGALSIWGGVAIDPDYNPFYDVVQSSEEEFFNPEHDHITQIDEADGLIYLFSELDDALSRIYIEDSLGMAYEGQTIRTEIVMDAETYEIVRNVETMFKDGEETVVGEVTAQYDTPEPLACRLIRGCFERKSENMMTVTYVVDPDTDHGFTRQLTVPVNTEACGFFYEGDAPFVYFDDPDCETLTKWDRMSDTTLYVFTNPDDALIEKHAAMLAELLQDS